MKTSRMALAAIFLFFGFVAQLDAFPRMGGSLVAQTTGGVTFTPTAGPYYLSPTGSDGANGLTPGTAWASPNHNIPCGAVIIAAAGAYSSAGFQSWGAPTNCPSTTGGTDGTGGVYFAILLCGGSYVGACTITTTGTTYAMDIPASNWAVEGWQLSAPGGGRSFVADACASGTTITHHVAAINMISVNSGVGFAVNDCALNHNVPGNGVDQFAVVGSIAQNSANDPICVGAIDDVGPANFDNSAGTHIFFSQDFGIKNQQATACPYDGEAFFLDTPDAHGYTGQVVFKNNIGYLSARDGMRVYYQNYNTSALTIKLYNNTLVANNAGTNTGAGFAGGDLFVQSTVSTLPYTVTIQNNIVQATYSTIGNQVGSGVVYAYIIGGNYTGVTTGGAGNENLFKGLAVTCLGTSCDSGDNVTAFNSGSFGTNLYVAPSFANLTDLLANWTGAPNCSGYTNVVQCMGWNYGSQTAVSNTPIGDLVAGASQAAGKGYVPPTPCAADADFPTYLKSIVYLTASGGVITQNPGAITKPCGL